MSNALLLRRFIYFLLLNFAFSSCSVQKQISKSAKENVLSASALQTAHVGISIYEPAANKYWYNYQGDHYFVPASNTKIPTCYAAMKYLGDSLVGLRYRNDGPMLLIIPSADPTFLNEEFAFQPVLKYLKENGDWIVIRYENWVERKWGSGWTWTDYLETYMAERSPMPLYGNLVKVYDIKENTLKTLEDTGKIAYKTYPGLFSNKRYWENPAENLKERNSLPFMIKDMIQRSGLNIRVGRRMDANRFYTQFTSSAIKEQIIPFSTSVETMNRLLEDTIAKKVLDENNFLAYDQSVVDTITDFTIIHSQPTDSLLKPMMHRSDNFFAEQSLLMVSNEKLGIMSDEKIIDTLLKTDFKDLPQTPRWVDGSGLSRYNLFSPQDFITILNKMKNEFGMERIKVIFPTGGEGTISSYYKTESGYLFAKTGTLSGVVAISGFLYTKKSKLLIFSILVNNHNASGTDVRRAVEKFLQKIRNKY